MANFENKSRILVVLPTLGQRLETLKETLESIHAQKEEVDLTLALVVPVSAVEARELGVSYGAVLIDDPQTGISEAINLGVSARTNEEYYAWMGDDDLYRPGGLFILQELLDNNPKAVVAYGGCEYIDSAGTVLATNRAGKLAKYLLPWGPDLIPHPGSMIKIDYLLMAGKFDSRLKYAMDLDMFLKLRKFGKFVSTKQSVSAFRWHPDSLTVSNRSKSSLESEAVKAKHLPSFIRPFRFFWQYPVRWASAIAANSISRRA